MVKICISYCEDAAQTLERRSCTLGSFKGLHCIGSHMTLRVIELLVRLVIVFPRRLNV